VSSQAVLINILTLRYSSGNAPVAKAVKQPSYQKITDQLTEIIHGNTDAQIQTKKKTQYKQRPANICHARQGKYYIFGVRTFIFESHLDLFIFGQALHRLEGKVFEKL